MTRRSAALKTAALAIALLFGFALRGRAQSTEGYVDIIYDEFNDEVRAFAVTYPDYSTYYYYVPHVHVDFEKHSDTYPYYVWLGDGYGTGGEIYNDLAITSVSTPFSSGGTYSAYAEHCVDAYYYYEVNPYCQYSCNDWYDCYGYSSLTRAPTSSWPEWTWHAPLVEVFGYMASTCLGPTAKEEVELAGPPILEVWNGGTPISQNQTVLISAGSSSSPPEMPALAAHLTSATLTGSVTWKIRVDYSGHGRTDSDWFPSSNGTTLPATSTWNTSFDSSMRGGTATLYYRYNNQTEKYFPFVIGGTNPSTGDALTKLGSSPWFLTRLARQESGLQQFSGSGPLAHDDPGGSVGFGLMMITNPPATSEQIWNWHANVTEGKSRVDAKDSALTPNWNQYLEAWTTYNQNHQGQEVPAPGPEDQASCHFVWNGGLAGSESTKSLRDAAWIKRYNGILNGHDYVMWNGAQNQWAWWREANGSNYVNLVCSKAP